MRQLIFRLRYGFWCEHVAHWPGDYGRLDGWRMIHFGMSQLRQCCGCGRWETR